MDYGTTILRSFCACLTGVVLGSSAHSIVYGRVMLAPTVDRVAWLRNAAVPRLLSKHGPLVFGYVPVLAEVEDGFSVWACPLTRRFSPSPSPVHWVPFLSG